eukprot:207144-Chlamydomonas_euryale.AAC.13
MTKTAVTEEQRAPGRVPCGRRHASHACMPRTCAMHGRRAWKPCAHVMHGSHEWEPRAHPMHDSRARHRCATCTGATRACHARLHAFICACVRVSATVRSSMHPQHQQQGTALPCCNPPSPPPDCDSKRIERTVAAAVRAQEYKENGLVKDVFAKQAVMDKMPGTSGIAHVRYPTAGSSSAQEAQVRRAGGAGHGRG